MSVNAHIDIDTRALREAIKRLGRRETGRRAAEALNEWSSRQVRVCANRLPTRWGALRRSIQARKAAPGDLRAVVGSALVYARIHHHGGTIRPSSSPSLDLVRRRAFGAGRIGYLTVPLTRFGVPAHARARDYAGLFKVRTASGKLFLAQAVTEASDVRTRRRSRGFSGRLGHRLESGPAGAKRRGLRFLFMLVPSTTIRRTPYMFISAEDRARLSATLARHLGEAVR